MKTTLYYASQSAKRVEQHFNADHSNYLKVQFDYFSYVYLVCVRIVLQVRGNMPARRMKYRELRPMEGPTKFFNY